MRVLIVGAGVTGLTLWRCLARRGITAQIVDRAPGPSPVARPFMMASHAFPALEEAGVMEAARDRGWEIAGRPGEPPVAIATSFTGLVGALADGVPVRRATEVAELLRDGGRVTGALVRGPDGEERVAADLVVAADGAGSPTRALAGIEARRIPAPNAHLSFISPVLTDRPFRMRYLGDGSQAGLIGWPEGSSGWWFVDPVGREAALAPGLDAFRAAFTRLVPEAAAPLAALTSVDQLAYRDITEVRCPAWWVPGVVVIGDAAHFLGPESGIGAGLGLADAKALAESVAGEPEDPDAACRHYDTWWGPRVRPYEAIGNEGGRMPVGPGAERLPEEYWPPRG